MRGGACFVGPGRAAWRRALVPILALMVLQACHQRPARLASASGCAVSTLHLTDAELTLLDHGILACLASHLYPRAQLELGRRFEEGREVAADAAMAAHWYARAAGLVPEQGATPVPRLHLGVWSMALEPDELRGPASLEARYRLGQSYVAGRGVPARPDYGRKLMDQAVRRGYRPPPGEAP